MSHEVETMAWANEKPWHGLGKEVSGDLTPAQMLKEAGLDWTVEKSPAWVLIGDEMVSTGRSALVRSSDNSILDMVSDEWMPLQNQEAFEFFNDFIGSGDMAMETAGSLKNGQIVWGLARVKESFELFGGDKVDAYLHFTNFHKYGNSTDVRFTPIRVVCNNTLTLSLNTRVDRMVKISHRQEFNGDDVKLMLGVAHEKLEKYKEMAAFLGSKRTNADQQMEYFGKVFGFNVDKDGKATLNRNAEKALEVVNTQPGHNFAEGSWWQNFNAVTFMTDHVLGRNADNRLTSAWYGQNKGLKTNALELAVSMAEAA